MKTVCLLRNMVWYDVHTAANYRLGKNLANHDLKLIKFSIGTGDRFAHQVNAQLQACVRLLQQP